LTIPSGGKKRGRLSTPLSVRVVIFHFSLQRGMRGGSHGGGGRGVIRKRGECQKRKIVVQEEKKKKDIGVKERNKTDN